MLLFKIKIKTLYTSHREQLLSSNAAVNNMTIKAKREKDKVIRRNCRKLRRINHEHRHSCLVTLTTLRSFNKSFNHRKSEARRVGWSVVQY